MMKKIVKVRSPMSSRPGDDEDEGEDVTIIAGTTSIFVEVVIMVVVFGELIAFVDVQFTRVMEVDELGESSPIITQPAATGSVLFKAVV